MCHQAMINHGIQYIAQMVFALCENGSGVPLLSEFLEMQAFAN